MFKKAAVTLPVIASLAACGGGGGGATTVDVDDAIFSAAAAPGASEFTITPESLTSDTGVDDTNFAAILNDLRGGRGFDALSYDTRLDAAAQKYAAVQATQPSLSHVGPDGSRVEDRIRAEGYDPRGWAENIARGFPDQADVLQAWIDSPGHNANLNAGLEDFGIGAVGTGSNLTWVLVLATER